MAYDCAGFVDYGVLAPPVRAAPRGFRRSERLVVLVGGCAAGAFVGFALAIGLGSQNLWTIILTGAPILAFALYLTSLAMADALTRNARGCATAAGIHAAALLAWPFTSLFTPLGELNFFIAPALALASLVLFASCFSGGAARPVYRLAAQGALVTLIAGYQGFIVVMAN